jgi:hypothetical protein
MNTYTHSIILLILLLATTKVVAQKETKGVWISASLGLVSTVSKKGNTPKLSPTGILVSIPLRDDMTVGPYLGVTTSQEHAFGSDINYRSILLGGKLNKV